MPLFIWSEAFETGHKVIDSQHRHLVDIINRLHLSANSHLEGRVSEELLQELHQYTQYHFNTEEKLMARSGFVGLNHHRTAHVEFINKLSEVKSDSLISESGPQLFKFLIEWLSEHILNTDMKMVAGLRDSKHSDTNNKQILLNALHESESRFRQIADHFPALLWICDDAGQRTFLNDAWCILTGADSEALEGDGWRSFVHPHDLDRYVDQLEKALVQQELFDIEFRLKTETDDYRWVQEKSVPRYIDGDRFIGFSGAGMDISPIKEAQRLQASLNKKLLEQVKERTRSLSEKNDSLKEAQQQLVQSEKMAAIGQLAAGVAHEINNPVGYIKSNVSTLEKYTNNLITLTIEYERIVNSSDKQADSLELHYLKSKLDVNFVVEDLKDLITETKEGLEKIERIVNDLKGFSRIDGTDWQYAQINNCLDSTLNVAIHEIKYKAELVKEYGDLPEIECLPHSLCQVFMNLMVNAAQAIEDKGKITLRTVLDNDHIIVEIEDNGKGIPADIQGKIFDPFFTTKPVGKGTGLGLSISYGIVEKHGGEMKVSSTVGEGTCFNIRLPIEQQSST